MMHATADEIVNRFTIAATQLLQDQLDPAFADDSVSLFFVAGPPLTPDLADSWAITAKETRMDIVYLSFEPGRERFGPSDIAVFIERSGVVFRWTDCDLWAPRRGGPWLIMPKNINVCFSHDGRALLSHASRPTQSVSSGIKRAATRLKPAARAVRRDQLDKIETDWKRAA